MQRAAWAVAACCPVAENVQGAHLAAGYGSGRTPLVLSRQVFARSGLQSHLGSCLELHHLLLGDGDGSASGWVDALMSGTCGH